MINDLDRVLAPRAVAVIGASRDPQAFSRRVVKNLVEGGFAGRVAPVNPAIDELEGRPCYPSVLAAPFAIDLAVVATPAATVARVVAECGEKGVAGVAIMSAGFGEAGPEGERRLAELLEVGRRGGVRILGPSSMGLINTDPGVRLNATMAPLNPVPGSVSILSESGSMGMAILGRARELSINVAKYVSIGAGADVSINEVLAYLGEDDRTQAILLYLERLADATGFAQLARRITPKKPILAVKAGRALSRPREDRLEPEEYAGVGVGGPRDAAVDALFEKAGVVRAKALDELFDVARAIGRQPLPKRETAAVLTNGIGPGIMTVDALEAIGLEAPPLDRRTLEKLGQVLGRPGRKNPVDLRDDARPADYQAALEPLLADPNVDAVIIIFVGESYLEFARAIIAAPGRARKTLLVCLLGGRRDDPGLALLDSNGIPAYVFPESACQTLKHLAAFHRVRAREPERPRGPKPKKSEEATRLIAQARSEGRLHLARDEIRAVAAAYGARTLRQGVARSEDDAARIAREIGYPVAVKAISTQIRKKSDIGAVILDLRTDREVKAAYREVLEKVHERHKGAQDFFIQVQQLLKGGIEFILQVEYDPAYGHLIGVGAGGPYSDLIRDFQYRLAPVTPGEAADMVRALKLHPLFLGHRGKKPVPASALIDAIRRGSQLVTDFPEIFEFEINPLIIFPGRKEFFAVDGKIRLFAPAKNHPEREGTKPMDPGDAP